MAKVMLTAGGIVKMKAGAARRELHDAGAQGLHLLIQKSGAKSFALRFRRPGGARTKITLGVFNPGDPSGEPRIGGPLTLAQARALAATLNLERAGGADIFTQQRVERQRRQMAVGEAPANSFSAAVRLFTENHKVRKTGERPKRWKETASVLGLKYPLDGSEPTVIKGGLCATWSERGAASITSDDIFGAIERAKRGRKGKRSESAGRHMASALASMFGWLHRNRRIPTNPCVGVSAPPFPFA